MKHVQNTTGVIIVIVILLSIGVPRESPVDTDSLMKTGYGLSADSGEVTDVPYVWQEINGFCQWATVSMALQKIGVNLDLAGVLAASGVGFTAGYIRYEDIWLFLAGSMYQQQRTLATFADLFGFKVEFYIDTDSTDLGPPFALILESRNVNWTEVDGWDDAIQILKNGIDCGFPVGIWVNLQNLPASDYDIIRSLGVTDITPTHLVLITGYNETSGIAQVMDPAIGLFDDPASYPEDGSWFYEINFTSLNQAWLGFYAMTIVKPGPGRSEDFTYNLVNYILNRLRGDRNSYAPGSEDTFFWNYGSNAFRAMAGDLTDTGLSSFMDEFDEYNLHTKSIILQDLGIKLELCLTQQSVAYQAAIDAIPKVLPDIDLQNFVSEGKLALEHFEQFADNSTANTPFYTGGVKMVTKTFEKIAYQFEHVLDGDLSSAVSVYDEDLAEIRTHLNAIADIWDATADALDRALQGTEEPPLILLSASIAGIVVLVIVIGRRKTSI
ncbi:MAG: hypothetical protein ACFFF9_01290 [Candidatus Thorarchaeota archaeon]